MTGTAMAPAGWYPDAERPGGLRWWDGEQWTEHRHDPLSALVADAPADSEADRDAEDAESPAGSPPAAGLVGSPSSDTEPDRSAQPPDTGPTDTTPVDASPTVTTPGAPDGAAPAVDAGTTSAGEGSDVGAADGPLATGTDEGTIAPVAPTAAAAPAATRSGGGRDTTISERPPVDGDPAVDGDLAAPAVAPAAVDVPEVLFEEPRRRFFGARKALEAENQQLRRAFETIGVFERRRLQQEVADLRQQLDELDAALRDRRAEAHAQLNELRSRVVDMTDRAVLHELGMAGGPVTRPTADQRLQEIAERIDAMASSGAAVVGAVHADAVHRDDVEPRLVLELHKLVLRSYNIEAEDALRSLHPGALAEAAQRLEHARATVARLGALLHIEISDDYHRLRLAELSAVAEHLAGEPPPATSPDVPPDDGVAAAHGGPAPSAPGPDEHR